MRRRTFVASGLGLIAAAAGQEFVGTFTGLSLRAQPAGAPAASRNPAAPPQGKWIKLAPFPQATGELLGAAINGKLYASQGLLPGFKPAGLVYEYDPASDAWTQKKPMPHPVHHAAITVSIMPYDIASSGVNQRSRSPSARMRSTVCPVCSAVSSAMSRRAIANCSAWIATSTA